MTAPVSLQLYTVRECLEADVDAALARAASIGFREVEPYGFPARSTEIAAALRANGLTAPTVLGRLLTEGTDVDAMLDGAAEVGAHTVIDPYIAAERWRDADGVARIADDLNALALRTAQRGLQLGYHNHWWETEYRLDDEPALEVLAGCLDPAIGLEVDIYWALVGGVDPVGLLERLGDRVFALHVKDGMVATADGIPVKDGTGQVALGQAQVPVEACLRAAPHARRVIELDAFDGDVWAPVAAGWDYLRKRAGS